MSTTSEDIKLHHHLKSLGKQSGVALLGDIVPHKIIWNLGCVPVIDRIVVPLNDIVMRVANNYTQMPPKRKIMFQSNKIFSVLNIHSKSLSLSLSLSSSDQQRSVTGAAHFFSQPDLFPSLKTVCFQTERLP